MIVICKKQTKKLVKGLRYEAGSLWNDGTNKGWLEGSVDIIGIGRYSVDNFTNVDGKAIPKINIIVQTKFKEALKFEELKKGDILICTSDEYKTLGKDCMYQIEEVITKSFQKVGWNNVLVNHTHQCLKFVGISRSFRFSFWRFRKLTANEAREISLNSVLNGEDPVIVKSKGIRKIDLVANKEFELMSILSKSIIDPNRHYLSITEWACQKTGAKLGIKTDDYKDLLDMPLKNILNIIERK